MIKKIALVGNPNAGKTSVFNQLTGLWQRTGNFPGVTVERKKGKLNHNGIEYEIIDLPGTYSLYPISLDEKVVTNVLSNPTGEDFPDAIIYIADVSNLERSLLLFSQIQDLKIPAVFALNMCDNAIEQGLQWDSKKLEKKLGVTVVETNGRTKQGIESLKKAISEIDNNTATKQNYDFTAQEAKIIEEIQKTVPNLNAYTALIVAHNIDSITHLSADQKSAIQSILSENNFKAIRCQVDETMKRYETISPLASQIVQQTKEKPKNISDRIDTIITHPLLGPFIFFAIIFLVFQAIFAWAEIPMEWIDNLFSQFAAWTSSILPETWWSNLISNGIIPGIGGVVIFIPQIAILFFFITLLEDIGYMARAVFMFDKIMQKFGLSGRSIVALISGGACAIPAIMSTRTIQNSKERLITILVTPLISCSARIPVFAILIGFAIPSFTVLGIFNSQGVAFFCLYLLGAVAALLSSYVFKKILKSKEPSYLMLSLPTYQLPHWKSIVFTIYQKSKSFVINAGKIILMVSIALWFLASYGPGNKMQTAEEKAITQAQEENLDQEETDLLIADYKLENSYAGHLGKAIEPAIAPLGYDWKIGIAIITSFAAREVFVGTLATLYSVQEEDESTLKSKMQSAINRNTGEATFTMAASISLLLFYLFAMQCLSTLAITRKETNTWKWPAVQFIYMTALAYIFALVAYQILK